MGCPFSGANEPAKDPDRCLRVSIADREYVRTFAEQRKLPVKAALAEIIQEHRAKGQPPASGPAAAPAVGGA